MTPPPRLLVALVALSAATASAGCFTYLTVPLDAAPTGEDVRVYVSRRGMAEVPEELASSGDYLTGRLMRPVADSLLLQIPVTSRVAHPGSTLDLRQNVFLPRAEVLEIRRRELSRSRTVGAIAGAAGFGVAVLLVVIEAGGNADGGDGEGPDQIRLPLHSVTVP